MTLQKRYNVGIDLGATRTKLGIVDCEGRIVFSAAFLTPGNAVMLASYIAENTASLVRDNNISWENICGIGIGCPAPMLDKRGNLHSLVNIDLKDFNFSESIKAGLKKQGMTKDIIIRLINDADAATLAEHRLGSGKGYKHMVMLTIGTGLGSGIIINGELYRGVGVAGGFGHMMIVPYGKKCGCGAEGCLEAYASISALVENAEELRHTISDSNLNKYKTINGKTVFECYLGGDAAAKLAVHEFIRYLCLGIINIANILRPQVIVIGGGVSALSDTLLELINDELNKTETFLNRSPMPILRNAEFGNNAAVIGAALVC